MNKTFSPKSPVLSPDAADRLELAMLFMIRSYLDGKLVEKRQVVNLLEDLINRIERERIQRFMDR